MIITTSTGNFTFTQGTRDAFDFYLVSNGAPIDLTGVTVSLTAKQREFHNTVSYMTNATTPRLSVLNAASGAVRFRPYEGDFTITGTYEYKYKLFDTSSNPSYVPEDMAYTLTVLEAF